MLHEGMYVRTSYNTGPYRITHITRGCTCPKHLDEINNHGNAQPSAPHTHIMAKRPSDTPRHHTYHLNGFDEETLCSVWSSDRLYVVSQREIDLFHST